ncbi:MAG: penicillin acylase family protein, partial [Actinomycetota bacterium]
LRGSVTVRRDAWGVPYIEASSLEDLWFAQGVVTAGERLFQLDLALRVANGRLSELFGARTVDSDRLARTVGFHRAGDRVAAAWDEDSVAMHERFRAGVAAWVAAMPSPPIEYTLLDLRPELPGDVGAWAAAFVYLSWGLSGNAQRELLRAWIAERAGLDEVARLMPPLPEDPPLVPAGAMHGALFDAIAQPGGRGSNEWVVAPSRTSTGGALLANDPHLDAVQPGVWIEMHLSAPGYRARGVALPWSPGIVLGSTAHHAWGATNVSGDVQDLFVEQLSDDGTAVRRGDTWSPLVLHPETIVVRGEEPVELRVRVSSNGPLLDTFPFGEGEIEHVPIAPAQGSDTAFSLAWTGLQHAIQPSLTLRAVSATSFGEFRRAVQGVTCPGQNFVYADVEGTIGYACTGVHPVRRAGDGTMPSPAGDSTHGWSGEIDPDELPWGVNPARGFLVTANNRVHDASYPHLIGRDFHVAHRARRIAEVLAGGDAHDVASTAALQADTVSVTAREIVGALARLEPSNDDQRLALDLLRGWDGDVRADSAAAAVFQVWSAAVARRVLEPLLGEVLFGRYHADREVWHCSVLPTLAREGDPAPLAAALEDAVAELRQRLGADPAGWRWGALHRLRLAHPLATIPGLEPLFTAADAEIGGDESTVMQTSFDSRERLDAVVIPSWRAVYDLADLDRSVGVLPTGISGNPASPHWNDQAHLWLAGATHPLPFSDAAVAAAAVADMRLVPGSISN